MNNDHNSNQEESVETKDMSFQEKDNHKSDAAITEKLEQQVQECKEMLSHWKDQYVRLAADFENFKKRLEKERAQTSRNIKAALLSDLLPVVDNFERALSAEQKTDNIETVLQGFEMIYKDVAKILQKQGVTPMAFDRHFNPELHEAVMTVASDEHNSGEIVEVLEKGYMIDGEVLRPAKVSIAA